MHPPLTCRIESYHVIEISLDTLDQADLDALVAALRTRDPAAEVTPETALVFALRAAAHTFRTTGQVPVEPRRSVDLPEALRALDAGLAASRALTFEVFTDGACSANGAVDAPGGWAAVFTDGREFSGRERSTTNVRMEFTAAIRALAVTPEGSKVILHSDLLMLSKIMNGEWKGKANPDLLSELRALSGKREVTWRWVKGHSGHPSNERADTLAQAAAQGLRASGV